MSDDSLLVSFSGGVHYVCWYSEEGGEGAWVGQEQSTNTHAMKDPEQEIAYGIKRTMQEREWEEYSYFAIELAAADWVKEMNQKNGGEDVEVGVSGYFFRSEKVAKSLLKMLKVALKNAKEAFDMQLPDWAAKAHAAGWTPPKGWKP